MAAVWDSSPLEKCLFEKNSQAENCCFVWPPGVQTLRVSLQKTHFRGQRNLSVANFSLYVRLWTAHLKVDSTLFFCEKGRRKKKQTLSWGFAFIRVSLNLEKVRDRDRDSFYPSLNPSFISSSDHLSHRSLGQALGATRCSLYSEARFSLAADNMLQTDCALCSSSLLYVLLL